MPPTYDLKKDVFLSCQGVFSGQYSQVRQPKAIRKRLSEAPHSATLALTKKHGLDTIAMIARDLLERQIFESSRRAEAEFPDLRQKPAASTVVAIHPPKETKKPVGEATDSTSKPSGGKGAVVKLPASQTPARASPEPTSTPTPNPTCKTTDPDTKPTRPRTLPSASLSFPTQHHILTLVQSLLEQACYDFSTHNLPRLLKTKNWDCSQAAELTKWLRGIKEHFPHLAPRVSSTEADFHDTYIPAAERLRHAVVHREPMTALALLILLGSCSNLAAALHDTATAAKIATLVSEIERVVSELDSTKTTLEDCLQTKLKSIEEQARLLMREQEEAVTKMAADAQRVKMEVSEGLERRVEEIFGEGKEKARSVSVSTVVDEGDGLDGRVEGEGEGKGEDEVQIIEGEDLICCEGEEVTEMGGGHVFIAF